MEHLFIEHVLNGVKSHEKKRYFVRSPCGTDGRTDGHKA